MFIDVNTISAPAGTSMQSPDVSVAWCHGVLAISGNLYIFTRSTSIVERPEPEFLYCKGEEM